MPPRSPEAPPAAAPSERGRLPAPGDAIPRARDTTHLHWVGGRPPQVPIGLFRPAPPAARDDPARPLDQPPLRSPIDDYIRSAAGMLGYPTPDRSQPPAQ